MKNIQIIDSAENCVYDIYAATDQEFAQIFPDGTDVAFADELESIPANVFANLWNRRVKKPDANGIHGTIFYGLSQKKRYYPTRRDDEACNPDGTKLRPPVTH